MFDAGGFKGPWHKVRKRGSQSSKSFGRLNCQQYIHQLQFICVLFFGSGTPILKSAAEPMRSCLCSMQMALKGSVPRSKSESLFFHSLRETNFNFCDFGP